MHVTTCVAKFVEGSSAHRNIFAVNGHPQGARYGGDPYQRSGRDLRLDLFRGLSLIFIFIDHVPDNVLPYLTLQSFSFCDAAEVFIFISGYAAALYVVLLGIFPPVLLLLRRHLALPVMVSGVIYLLTLHFGWQPHSYPDDEAWYFNPLAWQFLFVIGATAGYAPYSRQVLTMPSARGLRSLPSALRSPWRSSIFRGLSTRPMRHFRVCCCKSSRRWSTTRPIWRRCAWSVSWRLPSLPVISCGATTGSCTLLLLD